MATLFTIGHGTKTTDGLAAELQAAGAELLVDVRRFPGSRKHPHLARERLEADLPGFGITYSWWGEQLGGRRSRNAASGPPAWRNPSFQAYADHMEQEPFRKELQRLESVAEGMSAAVMCAESLWWRCHRRLIADALVVRGHHVVHIMGAGKHQAHPLNPSARRTTDGWLVYEPVAPMLDL